MLLGVIFADSFHVNYILKICSQRSYLIGKLRDQGLITNQLNIVFGHSVSYHVWCTCVHGLVFLSAEHIGRRPIDAFLRRMFKYGFCNRPLTFLDISGSLTVTVRYLNLC